MMILNMKIATAITTPLAIPCHRQIIRIAQDRKVQNRRRRKIQKLKLLTLKRLKVLRYLQKHRRPHERYLYHLTLSASFSTRDWSTCLNPPASPLPVLEACSASGVN